jgi:hypothetical protein
MSTAAWMIKFLHGWRGYRLTAASVKESLLLPVTSGPAELLRGFLLARVVRRVLLATAAGRVGFQLLMELCRGRRRTSHQ